MRRACLHAALEALSAYVLLGLAKAFAKCWGHDKLTRADLCWTAGLSILSKAKVGH